MPHGSRPFQGHGGKAPKTSKSSQESDAVSRVPDFEALTEALRLQNPNLGFLMGANWGNKSRGSRHSVAWLELHPACCIGFLAR